MTDDPTSLGLIDEDDIVLDEAALSLALLDHPETDPTPYRDLFQAVADRLAVVGREAATAQQRAAALSTVLHDEFGFVGDAESYDDPANADLIRVVDRLKGLPISLSILYVAAARRLGWSANVLAVPGHVLVLVGEDAAPVIVDPFRGGGGRSPRAAGGDARLGGGRRLAARPPRYRHAQSRHPGQAAAQPGDSGGAGRQGAARA